jgi:hypothetical protein
VDENVSARTGGLNPTGRTGAPANGRHSKFRKFKIKHITIAVAAVVILAVLTAGGLFLFKSSTTSTIDSNKYQALFLSNGQVYFGKLSTLNSEYIKLTDIFYLQTKAADASENPQKTSSASDVQLIKLGSEVHGPDDQMIISKDQVLFFENLKTDGTVAKSIDKYHKQ